MNKLFISLVSIFVFLISTNLMAQPKLEIVGGDTVNWGQKRLDESPLIYRLKLINIGDEKLVFGAVNPSCGCTTAPIDKDELVPGDSAFIDITFNLPSFEGSAKKAIQIKTNAPNARSKLVYLVADVVFPLKFFPAQRFMFHGVLVGDSTTSRVIMTNTTDEDIILKDVYLTGSEFTTNLKSETVLKAKEDLTIDVTAKPLSIGTQTGEIGFKTTHPDVVRVKIPIVMNVQGEVIQPEQIPKY